MGLFKTAFRAARTGKLPLPAPHPRTTLLSRLEYPF